jgi:ribosomal protein S18 acetylase RimI-like enzyme
LIPEELKIRAVELADLNQLVKLHKQCFKADDNLSLRLGHAFLRVTYRFFLTDPLSFGFLALWHGTPAGFVVGRLDFYVRALSRYRMWAALIGLITHPWVLSDRLVINRILRVASFYLSRHDIDLTAGPAVCDPNQKTATLASLGVHHEYARLGISDHLLTAAEEFCRGKGIVYLRASVIPANVASRFLYRRRGYVEDKVLRTPDASFYSLRLN